MVLVIVAVVVVVVRPDDDDIRSQEHILVKPNLVSLTDVLRTIAREKDVRVHAIDTKKTHPHSALF